MPQILGHIFPAQNVSDLWDLLTKVPTQLVFFLNVSPCGEYSLDTISCDLDLSEIQDYCLRGQFYIRYLEILLKSKTMGNSLEDKSPQLGRAKL